MGDEMNVPVDHKRTLLSPVESVNVSKIPLEKKEIKIKSFRKEREENTQDNC